MPDDLIRNVADLARTCFQAGCYGNVSVYSKPSTTKVDNVIDQSQSDSLRIKDMSVQQTEEDGVLTTPKQHISFGNPGDQDRPGVVVDDINRQESPVSEDEDVCTFIQNYCFLLDLCRVKEKLHSYHGNLFQFWCTYIKCLQEFYKKDIFFVKLMNKEVHYAVDILKTGGYSAEKMLSCVTKLFEENLHQALEICQDSIHIQPLDVYYMCQYHSQSVSQYFSPYMYTRVNDVMTTNRQCDSVYGHPLIRLKWLEMMLVENRPTVDLTGKDNAPRPGSHLADWKKPEFILHVLNSAADDREKEDFLELVQSSGFWLGYLQLLQQLQRREEVLTTVVHLGDINLFGGRYNYLPETKQEWTFVVKYLHKQYKSQRSGLITGETSCKQDQMCTGDVTKDSSDKLTTHLKGSGKVSKQDCEDQDLGIMKKSVGINESVADTSIGSPGNLSYISWDDFASLMLCHLGPVATVTILQECDLQKGQMSSYFHQSALITMLLDRTKRNVTHNLLEKLDSYLWAKKPTTLMPELRYSVMQEKMAKGASLSTSQRDKDSLIAYMPEAVQPCERYQEDTECHWGISTKMTRTCMCCNLSLTEAVSHVEPGVLSFQCGHVFHRLCVPEKTCLLCGLPSRQQLTHV
ncbi:Hermansky-Pudlak syndrome 5 protein-like [Pecten maximus]|uniref:Hermansky-Pudlak syndrome 5 protein-like n=1 Tax=Pecten maximus TaxID=6579 RepID=UPI0014583637|nr:Hermansky-Pudlak syndrome 5 protein-like [Pecten maximus]